MKFISIQIKNYKSFEQSPKISLAPGRNIVVGQNNSGKTAFLESISLTFGREPHKTSQRPRGFPLPDVSEVFFEFVLSGTELRKTLLAVSGNLHLPMPTDQGPGSDPQDWLRKMFAKPEIVFYSGKHDNAIRVPSYPGFNLFTRDRPPTQAVIRPDAARSEFVVGTSTGEDTQFTAYVTQKFAEAVYFFSAERMTLANCPVGVGRTLTSNARNLAEVLHNLQDSNYLFGEFVQLVRRVLPGIQHISLRNMGNHLVEVFVSNYEDAHRDDLFVSLQKSGSGVGQVLAILYVLFSSTDPRTIVIDEPNSFLHPGAVRRLLEVIKEFGSHQFVISTHSPDVISNAEPERLIITRWVDTHTEIEVASSSQIAMASAALAEVGARLSDVYGADRILWVEGTTEERCFPAIARRLLPQLTSIGTAILGVPATGDLQSRRKELVLQIYKKLCGGSALIPPAIAFIFDRDSLSDDDVESYRKESGGALRFLPRRCYENYLLVSGAIVQVLNTETVDREQVTLESVNDWLEKNGTDRKFFRGTDIVPMGSTEWYRTVGADGLLQALFWELRLVAFIKTVHSYKLTAEVLKQQPREFDDLVELLKQVYGRA